MTYCVGIRLNAGLDQISTCRKMMVYEKAGDRFMVLLSAGNPSISQSVREVLQVQRLDNGNEPPLTIWNAKSMFDAAHPLMVKSHRYEPMRKITTPEERIV